MYRSNRIKKFYPEPGLCILLTALLILSGCNPAPPATDSQPKLLQAPGQQTQAKLPWSTLAEVNQEPVSKLFYELFTSQNKKPQQQNPQIARQQLDKLIDQLVLAQKARQIGLHNSDLTIKTHIKLQTTRLLADAYLQVLQNKLKISPAEIRAEYHKKYLQQENKEYKTSHIVVKTRQQAVALMRLLANGANFSELARKHSIAPSASLGGKLAWFKTETVNSEFANAVKKLHPGETSPYPLNTLHGWHLILLEKIKIVQPPDFESVKQQLHHAIRARKLKQAIKQLRLKSNIITDPAQL